MNKMNKKGFTLIEMLVVIAIIAVLVAIIIPVVGNSTAKAEAATDAANLRSAKAALTIAVLNNGAPSADTTYTADKYGDWVTNGTAPVAKSNGAGDFKFEIDTLGNVKVYFGTYADGSNDDFAVKAGS